MLMRYAPKVTLAGLLLALAGASLVAGVKAAFPPGEAMLPVRLGVALVMAGQGVLALGVLGWIARKIF